MTKKIRVNFDVNRPDVYRECNPWTVIRGLVNDFCYKPDTPVKAGIEKFIKWYKQYFFQF